MSHVLKPGWRKAFLGSAATVTGVALLVVVLFQKTPLSGGASTQPPLHTDGEILRQGAQRFVVKGAAVFMLPYRNDPVLKRVANTDFTQRDAIFLKMRSIGINTIRVPLGIGGDQKTELARLRTVVSSAESHHLTVVLTWWDSLYFGGRLPTSYKSMLPMMMAVHSLLGDDSSVTYEPLNEPNAVTWQQWYPIFLDIIHYWRSTIKYTGLLMVDTINHSSDFQPDMARTLLEQDKLLRGGGAPNLVFANHRYADANTNFSTQEQQSWTQTVGQYIPNYPILGTEYGYRDVKQVPHPDWNRGFLDYLRLSEVPRGFNGYIDFVWNWVDDNSMTAEANPLSLNTHGSIAKAHFDQPG